MNASMAQRVEIVELSKQLGVWPSLLYELRREYSKLDRFRTVVGETYALRNLTAEQADEVLAELRAALPNERTA